jgi:NADH:ubiquinone oxidoreductase subunit 3 (subunit A)
VHFQSRKSPEETLMQFDSSTTRISKPRLWAGRILIGLVTLFLLFDSAGKFLKPVQVMEACTRLGWPSNLISLLGIILLLCTILYAIPRTSILGATLLTGYLGGAVAINLRAGSSPFEAIFPVIFGAIAWAGIFLRDDRLRILTAREG